MQKKTTSKLVNQQVKFFSVPQCCRLEIRLAIIQEGDFFSDMAASHTNSFVLSVDIHNHCIILRKAIFLCGSLDVD